MLCLTVASFALLDVFFPLSYYSSVKLYCSEYSVEPSLVFAVIHVESKFKSSAVSKAGACGLMQLLPSTAEWLAGEIGVPYSDKMLFEPDYNIRLGVAYLGYLSERFEGKYVLAAYNAGEGNVGKWLDGDGEIEFPETQRYIKKVTLAEKIYSFRL